MGLLCDNKPKYVGTIGRVANRICDGKFILDNKEFVLATNNGKNHLHGGLIGFDKKNWTWRIIAEPDRVGAIFTYTSIDGEEGYPGNVQVRDI